MLCLELVLIVVFLLLFWGVGGGFLSFVVLGVFWGGQWLRFVWFLNF